MKHATGFIGLVEECMPRIKEISAAEVAARLYSPPPPAGEDRVGVSAPKNESMRAEGHPPLTPPAGGRGLILIDVREDSEWAQGHAQGAIHIGRGVLERDIERAIPDRDAAIVLYCGGGYRSALAADSLQKMGYSNVFSMAGGWRDWCAAGFERN